MVDRKVEGSWSFRRRSPSPSRVAAVGLYGFIACAIVRRTREIGIRIALGATRRDVLGFVVRQCAVVVGVAAVLGSVSAFVAARATTGVLFFGIDATDAPAWGGAIVVSITVGVVAHLVPALCAVGGAALGMNRSRNVHEQLPNEYIDGDASEAPPQTDETCG